MKDDRDELLDRLFTAARSMKPDTAGVEEYFETRLLARIRERRNRQMEWATWSWRLVPIFTVIIVMIGIGGAVIDPARSGDLFASFTNGYEEYLTTSLLAGG
jgi:hypothetical protein